MEQPGMQQIPMDVIAGIIFKQTVELEVLRGQLAQAKQMIATLRKEEQQKKEAVNDVDGLS